MSDSQKGSGRAGKSRTPKKESDSKAKRTLKKVLKGVVAFGLMLVIAGCIFGAVMTVYVIKYIDPNASIDLSTLKQTTMLLAYDEESGAYIETAQLYSEENRIWVDIGDVPDIIQKVVVASEDKRFYEHNGVDWYRTAGAFGNLIFGFWDTKQGGSTITQQVIKNVTQNKDVTIERKVQEIIQALNLEKTTSKDIILEAYINTMFLGYSRNGLQSAANFYFGKDVAELTVAEAASIVAITRYPTANNPILNPEKNRTVYSSILKTMLELDWLTREEYDEAMNQELVYTMETGSTASTQIWSWYEDQVINDVLKDLQTKKGYTSQKARQVLYNGGLRIYMAVDLEVQAALEEQYYDPAKFLKESSDEQPESAMVIMDYEGRVLGIVGGKGEKTKNLIWSRATDTTRSPGSAIKPIAVYAPALERDMIYWSKKMLDEPMKLNNGNNWPKNYYRGFKGYITLDEAIQRSTNTVAARTLDELTPEVSFDFLYNKLNVRSLVESERRNGSYFSDKDMAPLSMGSLTDGLTVLELAAAYQIFGGEGGLYTEPYTYTRVEDANGNIILENRKTATRVISEDTAFVMNKLLQRVVTGSHGTGTRASSLGHPVAAKTGTTSDYHDRWFVGLTPYYVGVVWTGYDIPKEMNENLSNPSLDAWLKVMKTLHKDKEKIDFFSSELVERRTYCTSSGHLASNKCASTSTGWYKKSFVVETCTRCQ